MLEYGLTIDNEFFDLKLDEVAEGFIKKHDKVNEEIVLQAIAESVNQLTNRIGKIAFKVSEYFEDNAKLSGKALQIAHARRLQTFGKYLVDLKVLASKDYCDELIEDTDTFVDKRLLRYLKDLQVSESLARKCIKLHLYEIQECFFFIGSERISRFIDQARSENIQDVNELMLKSGVLLIQDAKEAGKSIDIYLNYQLALRKVKCIGLGSDVKEKIREYCAANGKLPDPVVRKLKERNTDAEKVEFLRELLIKRKISTKIKKEIDANDKMQSMTELLTLNMQKPQDSGLSIDLLENLNQKLTEFISRLKSK